MIIFLKKVLKNWSLEIIEGCNSYCLGASKMFGSTISPLL